MAELRELELARRIREDVVLPREPPEKRPHRTETDVLRPKRERLPAALRAVVEEVPLVPLEDGLRHFRWSFQAPGVAPLHEEAQALVVVLHGPGGSVPDALRLEVRLRKRAQARGVGDVADRAPWPPMLPLPRRHRSSLSEPARCAPLAPLHVRTTT